MPTLDEVRADLANLGPPECIAHFSQKGGVFKATAAPGETSESARRLIITPSVSLFDAFSGLRDALNCLPMTKSEEQFMGILAMARSILGGIATTCLLREVQAYDCPHCKGPLPGGLDPDPNEEGKP